MLCILNSQFWIFNTLTFKFDPFESNQGQHYKKVQINDNVLFCSTYNHLAPFDDFQHIVIDLYGPNHQYC